VKRRSALVFKELIVAQSTYFPTGISPFCVPLALMFIYGRCTSIIPVPYYKYHGTGQLIFRYSVRSL